MAAMSRIPKDQILMGIHPIEELLRAAPEQILKILTAGEGGPKKRALLTACQNIGLPIQETSLQSLDQLCQSESHQGIAAHVKGRKFWEVDEFLALEKSPSLLIGVDQIFDPHNLGAIIRSAECFGADGVIWSKNRGADLTATAAKASSGASEWVRLFRVANIADTALAFQRSGYEIAAAALVEGASSLYEFSFAPKTLLLVGSEGEGLQPLLLKRADRHLMIPLQGKIDSLNVAQATAVLASEYRRQHS
jgi:23S rRNA (guanosine2251-2'-O)-methyltransferase